MRPSYLSLADALTTYGPDRLVVSPAGVETTAEKFLAGLSSDVAGIMVRWQGHETDGIVVSAAESEEHLVTIRWQGYTPRFVEVWHARENEFTGQASHFQHVANVCVARSLSEAQACEHVFERTNHIEQSWRDNSGVRPLAPPDECRSTSLGDVLRFPATGRVYRCAGVGWDLEEIPLE